MNELKLYMVLLGCKPAGRHTEQHDIFFGVGRSLAEIKGDIQQFWKEGGKIHIDGWREVNVVDGHTVRVMAKKSTPHREGPRLFFINLGGYKQNEFEEFHYKLLTIAPDKGVAIQQSKQSAFYKHTGFEGAVSHVDDKYGIDVDDIYEISDVLPAGVKEKFSIEISPGGTEEEDLLHLGYLRLDAI